MNENLNEALNEISDKHLAEAIAPKKKTTRKIYWLGAVAAMLALVIFLNSGGMAPAVSAATLIAAPEYPQMAKYPESGEYNSKEYRDWLESLDAQYDQPEGYAEGLEDYFSSITKALLGSAGDENAVCSPVNIYMALAMLAECTAGESRRQILDLLGADSIESLREQAGHVWNAHYRDDGMATSVLANSLWIDSGLTYNPNTAKTLAESYYSSVYQGDLQSSETASALRSWLNEQTGGLLEDQIQNILLDGSTVLALASTIYYKARWSASFHQELNTEDIFHAPSGDVDAIFMNRTDRESYYFWGGDYGAVRLVLDDGSYMWLILPDEGKTPSDVLERGEAMDMVLSSFDGWNRKERVTLNLSLPKFDVVSDTDLVDSLKQLGITEVFQDTAADFSPILPEDPAFVSQIKHAARVVIDEEGIEAAAYTVILSDTSAMPIDGQEVDFVLDRPFLFVITSSDGLPLFTGVVNEP